MSKYIFYLLLSILLYNSKLTPQAWQPIGIPEGSGITDLVYWKGSAPFDNKIWATTGSVDWPTGQRGGVFYSDGNGLWNRLGGSAGYYIGRTLAVGQDGNLYASLWRDPANFPADALCRLSVQAATFGLLYQAQAGDNIFSIAVKNNPHTIFAGTRNGVIRSTNNGSTFGYANTGIPDSAWVYDIAIDSSGVLGIATSKGVYISEDNGDNWLKTTGIPAEDTVYKLLFYNEPNLDGSYSLLLGGSYDGHLYIATEEEEYLIWAVIYSFTGGKIADISLVALTELNERRHSVALFNQNNRNVMPGNTGGFYMSSDNGISWLQEEKGMPVNPPVTALAFKTSSGTAVQLYAGLFGDTTNGAGVYKLDFSVDVEELNLTPSAYKLEQNYPNPFNPTTKIQFSLPKESFTKIEIFNSLGEQVSILVSENLSAGTYEYEWKPEGFSNGIYFYRLIAEEFSVTKKMLLIR